MSSTVSTSGLLELENNKDLPLRENLRERYQLVRAFSEKLCNNLETEDYVIQSMPDVSPTKWHLAHTSWFFETFLLFEYDRNYKPVNEKYSYLFNSYYVQAGERFLRPNRGLLSRPTVSEVYKYRKHVDESMYRFFDEADDETIEQFKVVVNIGLHHEQQHQELILTDIKHVFSLNPLNPVFAKGIEPEKTKVLSYNWLEFGAGVYEFGHDGKGFFYDNEMPLHKQYINGFMVADRLATNGEYIQFIEDGGYQRAELWLSAGFAFIEQNKLKAPGYWFKEGEEWYNFTLNGYRFVNLSEPVTHISYYEAEAFARWMNSRLLSEFEWELFSQEETVEGNFVETEAYHPLPQEGNNKQVFGDVWEWTKSDYAAYPGYIVPQGAIGEYNGKFMTGQYVLRGGSCATSVNHIRNTYRNFFPPDARWQFSGIRLAKDLR